MINFNNICVFQFDMDGRNPWDDSPIKLSAIMIDPRKLEIIDGSEFFSIIQPLDIKMTMLNEDEEEEDYYTRHKDVIDAMAKAEVSTPDKIIERLEKAQEADWVWHEWSEYLLRYNVDPVKRSQYGAPIPAGYNLFDKEWILMRRLARQFKDMDRNYSPKVFHPTHKFDAFLMCVNWLENLAEPQSYGFDTIRPYFGMDPKRNELDNIARLVIRFLGMTRKHAEKVRFKNAFKEVDDELA